MSDLQPDARELIITLPGHGTLDVDKGSEVAMAMTLTWDQLAEQVTTQFYDPNQPRDEGGRWTSTGGGGGGGEGGPQQLAAGGVPIPKALTSPGSDSPALDPVRNELYRAVKAENGGVKPSSGVLIAADLAEPGGGFTYDPKTGTAAMAGFSVSPYPELSRELDLSGMSADDVLAAVDRYEADHLEVLQQDNHWFGGWHDPETGKAWLDVSIVVESAAEARRIGAERDQIAFFDFQVMDDVTINRNATSGQGESK